MTLMQLDLAPLKTVFGDRLALNVPLARFTAARIGGPAAGLLQVETVDELVEAVSTCWQQQIPLVIVGGGSNVLVSDAGINAMVLVNHARRTQFTSSTESAQVWAESGANTGLLARQAAERGFGGLEWAAGIPGSLGGAVVGNAGAHGGDIAGNLIVAEILHPTGQREMWTAEQLEFDYRSSRLKRQNLQAVVLTATLRLHPKPQEEIQAEMNRFIEHRRRTQPPGASMGSMFKNPPGDFAGRLIEFAGLKGTRVGNAEISRLHGNFFVNLGEARAQDVRELIDLARRVVFEQTGIQLELEIELLGTW
ncbi:MAG: UDP-N-acetylmuramate dehydrogenase [Anaerolineales bacterium]|jgi:UDP-N-acetylmuramate dehydrogenase